MIFKLIIIIIIIIIELLLKFVLDNFISIHTNFLNSLNFRY